jgi:hypothetical protein
MRIEDTAPDTQDKAYHDRLKQLTKVLTGQSRSYLVGLQDTAM